MSWRSTEPAAGPSGYRQPAKTKARVNPNTGTSSIELPLFGYCVFTGKDGTTLKVEPFKSQWSQSVPPGVLSSGTVTFSGKLPAADKVASFSFTTIFGTFDDRAITVKRLSLRAPAIHSDGLSRSGAAASITSG